MKADIIEAKDVKPGDRIVWKTDVVTVKGVESKEVAIGFYNESPQRYARYMHFRYDEKGTISVLANELVARINLNLKDGAH